MDHQTFRIMRHIGRHYRRHPQLSRVAVTCLVFVSIFILSEHVGETLGKALYYLTH